MNLNQGPIVVPLDGSKNSESALLPATQLARAYGAPLQFLHVVEGPAGEETVVLPIERLDAYIRQLLGQVGGADLQWSAALLDGAPTDRILEAAEEARAVVMATHGRGGFHAAFIGSVTDKVVRSGQLPVLTVPVQGKANLMSGPVVVGLDGSEVAEGALPLVRDLASRLGVGITFLRAYSVTPSAGTEFVTYEYNVVSVLKDAAEDYLQRTAGEGEQTVTSMMSPANAINETAEQLGAGLVALTSHGRGLAYRLALGSTTDRVIHSVRRPVLVLPGERQVQGGSP